MGALLRPQAVASPTHLPVSDSSGQVSEQTLQSLQSDPVEPFEILVERYRDRVYRQAHRLLCNTAEVEDVVQEVFLLLHRKRHTFRGQSSFSTWFYRLTMNVILSRLRQQRRHQNLGIRLSKLDTEPAPSPEYLCTRNETYRQLGQAIASLQPLDRAVVKLCDLEQRSNQEAGTMLRLSVSAVKSRRHRARLTLRKSLAVLRDVSS